MLLKIPRLLDVHISAIYTHAFGSCKMVMQCFTRFCLTLHCYIKKTNGTLKAYDI